MTFFSLTGKAAKRLSASLLLVPLLFSSLPLCAESAEDTNASTNVSSPPSSSVEEGSVSAAESSSSSLLKEMTNPEEVAALKKKKAESKGFVSGQQNAVAYRNEQLGIAFDLPKGYILYPPNMLSYLSGSDEADMNRVPYDFEFFPQSFEFVAMKDGGYPKLSFVVEKEAIQGISLDDYLKTFQASMKKIGYTVPEGNPAPRSFAGQEYKQLSFGLKEQGEQIVQNFFFRKENDLFIYFSASARAGDEKGIEELLSGIKAYADAAPLSPDSLVKDPGSGRKFESKDAVYNPNRLAEQKAKEEAQLIPNFDPSKLQNVLPSSLILSNESVSIPTPFSKLAEYGFLLSGSDSSVEKNLLKEGERSPEIEIKESKLAHPYALSLAFVNGEKEEKKTALSSIFLIRLSADRAYEQRQNSEIAKLSEKRSGADLKANLKLAQKECSFGAGLSFSAKDEDVNAYFKKLSEKNKTIRKEENGQIHYAALSNDGKFVEAFVSPEAGLISICFADYSVGKKDIPESLTKLFS